MLDPVKHALSTWEQRHVSQAYRQFQLILSRWSDVVGEEVANHCQPISLQGQFLRVATSSSTWSQTLMFERIRIVAKLNAMLSLNLTDIRFQPGMVHSSSSTNAAEALIAKVQAEVRSHPSWIAPSPVSQPPTPPTNPKDAFERWSKQMIQRSRSLAGCPRCHCPTPPGELERWDMCSFCVSQEWHKQTAAKTAQGGIPGRAPEVKINSSEPLFPRDSPLDSPSSPQIKR